jgi:hypothetical protein
LALDSSTIRSLPGAVAQQPAFQTVIKQDLIYTHFSICLIYTSNFDKLGGRQEGRSMWAVVRWPF